MISVGKRAGEDSLWQLHNFAAGPALPAPAPEPAEAARSAMSAFGKPCVHELGQNTVCLVPTCCLTAQTTVVTYCLCYRGLLLSEGFLSEL